LNVCLILLRGGMETNARSWLELSDNEQMIWIDRAVIVKDNDHATYCDMSIYIIAEMLYNRSIKK